MSAYIYYTIPANATLSTNLNSIPALIFSDVVNLITSDYALFRYSVIVQSAYPNNAPISPELLMNNFSKGCSGQLQVYPKAFFNSSPQFSLTNEVNGSTTYQVNSLNSRIFYFTGNIYRDLSEFLTMSCSNINGVSTLYFNFEPMSLVSTANLIYSIQLELLNPGKMLIDSISTNNFTTNI